jgi:hypothetical protein
MLECSQVRQQILDLARLKSKPLMRSLSQGSLKIRDGILELQRSKRRCGRKRTLTRVVNGVRSHAVFARETEPVRDHESRCLHV